jgi:hypothetical protein
MRYGREDVLDAAECAPEGRLPCEWLGGLLCRSTIFLFLAYTDSALFVCLFVCLDSLVYLFATRKGVGCV